ncbi:polysaccharide deacetylase family protein [Paenibacillus sp. F411]|uniref:polysaccharide deacetylase family protein n=1 Tax=Paenibacillus sp. F411 TaxID=2820239 RepID=UPI001AAE9904|nr:polysaccharide deacetylase family protein [Paenibacillus sp. F411]MBO2944119.1 polysaccharide deacetylase family protein [Paenibacillus sp. F411]
MFGSESRKKIAVLTATVASISSLAVITGSVDYVRQLSHSAVMYDEVQSTAVDVQLLERIQAEAAQNRVEPIDAKVDSVWKAIPGYNGREIDVEETYRRALKRKSVEEIPYVYREIPAKVTLQDLGPHPIYRGNPNKPMVSLMINVAWGNEYIKPMLHTLETEGVKATFFLDGSWLSKNRELALDIVNGGHEVENHAYTHPNMSQLSAPRAESEITRTQELLKESLGVTNTWFAPPSGDYNQQTVQLAHARGLKTVLWTLDTVDWKHPPAQAVVDKISAKVEPGFLILMHPTDSSSQALKGMIQGIRAKGLHIGTVSQTLSPERVPPSES